MNAFTAQPAATPAPASISDLANAPARVRTDEGTVEERRMDDVIRGNVYSQLSNGTPAMAKPLWGIACASVRPPDALGRQNPDPFTPVFL